MINIRLRTLRKERGLTQVELAQKIGIGNKTISDYEREISSPDIESLNLIANFFNVSTDYLLGKSDDRNTPVSAPTPKEQLEGVKLALFDQVGDLSDDEARQVLDIIKIIKGDKK